jgi:hypothetical protein
MYGYIPYEYVDAIVDRRTLGPRRLAELAARRAARARRKRS